MVVLGDVNRLHVRVDIDENDLPRFLKTAKAQAHLKGRPEPQFHLDFVKVEPYVIPKKSLTGDNSERVDTRVLQVIYALPDHRTTKLYVGQQMDVFLDLNGAELEDAQSLKRYLGSKPDSLATWSSDPEPTGIIASSSSFSWKSDPSERTSIPAPHLQPE